MSQRYIDEYLTRKLRSKDPQERASARAVKKFLDEIRKTSEDENGFEDISKILGR